MKTPYVRVTLLLVALMAAALHSRAADTVPAALPSPEPAATAAPTTAPAPTVTDARATVDDTVDYLIDAENTLADAYFHDGDFEKTVATLDHVIELDPSDSQPYALAAWVLWDRDKARALDYYQRMVAADPNNPQVYFEVGQFYFINQQDYANAAVWLKQAIDHGLSINSQDGHLYGHALVKLRKNDDALIFWERCLAKDPTDAVAQREIENLKNPPATSPTTSPAPSPAPATPPAPTG